MPDIPAPVPGLTAGDRARLVPVLERARHLGFLGPGPVEDQIAHSLALLSVVVSVGGDSQAGGHDEGGGGDDGSGSGGGRGAHGLEGVAADDGIGVACGVRIVGGSAHGDRAARGRRTSEAAVTSGTPRRALDLGSGGGVPGLILALALPTWEWLLLDGSTRRAGVLLDAVEALDLEPRVSVCSARAEEAARGPLRGSFDVVVSRGFAAAAPTAECASGFLRVGGAAVITEPPGGDSRRWPAAPLAELGVAIGTAIVTPVAAQVLRQRSLCPARFPRRTGIPMKRPLWPPPSPIADVSRGT